MMDKVSDEVIPAPIYLLSELLSTPLASMGQFTSAEVKVKAAAPPLLKNGKQSQSVPKCCPSTVCKFIQIDNRFALIGLTSSFGWLLGNNRRTFFVRMFVEQSFIGRSGNWHLVSRDANGHA